MAANTIGDIVTKQREFFNTGKTLDLDFRTTQLKRLCEALTRYEDEILEAVAADMGKPGIEGYLTEVGMPIGEAKLAIKKLRKWAKPRKMKLPLAHHPGSSFITPQPYGVIMVIGPWNYPLNLLVLPLIGAIAAGNTAVLKPSELTPKTSKVTAKMFKQFFDPEYIAVVEGGVDKSQALLKQKFDYIFFTGGTEVGKKVMQAAAKHLTPVTLELGGKSPCIVTEDVKVDVAARRVAWGKFFNAGQTCIAPDYVLVQSSIKDEFLHALKNEIGNFYGANPQASEDYARIVNGKHLTRLSQLIGKAEVVTGGEIDRKQNYLAPTVITGVDMKHPSMKGEIFGPILPVMEFDRLQDAIVQINKGSRPLALYLFSNNKAEHHSVLTKTTSGGVCINDTLSHIVPNNLPFGGVGDSGMGAYHGKATFDTFSHEKSTMKRSMAIDLKDRYAPYKLSIKKAKKLISLMTG